MLELNCLWIQRTLSQVGTQLAAIRIAGFLQLSKRLMAGATIKSFKEFSWGISRGYIYPKNSKKFLWSF
jgi:hypothetical protein